MNKNDIKKLILEVFSEVKQQKNKLTREVFIYLEPKGPKEKFAQCATCRMWTGEDGLTCSILGKIKVTCEMSCNFYVYGKPSPNLKGKEVASYTPKEAGLVNRQVRCENCRSFDQKTSICMLFQSLNKSNPDLFQLEEKVNEYGCCNAQKPKIND
jgi:hypothetical protein